MPSRPRLTTSTMSQSSLQMVPLCSRESFSRSKALRILATAAPAPPCDGSDNATVPIGIRAEFSCVALSTESVRAGRGLRNRTPCTSNFFEKKRTRLVSLRLQAQNNEYKISNGGLKVGSKKSRNRRAVGPCRKSCSGGRSASQKKSKWEVRHAKQGSDPGVASAPLASPVPASATII